MSTENRRAPRWTQLDGLRGIAALCVVICHYAEVIKDDPALAGSAIQRGLHALALSPLGGLMLGLPAVLLFFVLSGFSLALMLRKADSDYASYAARRIIRIWPPYVMSILLNVLLIAWLGWPGGAAPSSWLGSVTGQPLHWDLLLQHLFLLWPFEAHYNFVAWTLVHELRISLFFPVIYLLITRFGARKALQWSVPVSIGAAGVSYLAKYLHMPILADLVISLHYALFFTIGAVLALHAEAIQVWYRQLDPRRRGLLVLIAVLSYTYPSQIRDLGMPGFPMIATHWMTLPSVTILLVLAISSPAVTRMLRWPLIQKLGTISYSLYLFHALVIFAVMGSFRAAHGTLMATAVGLPLSIVLAVVTYRAFERPSQKLGGRIGALMARRTTVQARQSPA